MPNAHIWPEQSILSCMNKSARVLAFDFGTKRIGVACGNRMLGTAEPLKTVHGNEHGTDWRAIIEIVEQWKPMTLIVGLPLAMSGEETEMSKAARKFGESLNQRTHIAVEFYDERLSSSEADEIIKKITPQRKKIKKKHLAMRDNLAAQLILQSYFDDN